MAVQRPTSKARQGGSPPRQRPTQVQYSAPKKKQKVPWWGWCIIALVAAKGCSTANAVYDDHVATTPPSTTIQGGQ